MTLSPPSPIQTDAWLKATWQTFTNILNQPQYEDSRAYFDNGYMRIEMAPLGAGHGRQNTVISQLVSLFGMVHNLRIVGFTNCSFRKVGLECQPDLAFYIGPNFQLPPQDNTPIDVTRFGPPTLAIEIGASSFGDDLGSKRLLYERLGIAEYWVVNVAERDVIAFAVNKNRSGEIHTSSVLPSLDLTLVKDALQRSQTDDDSTHALAHAGPSITLSAVDQSRYPQ
ncbi:MAG: Uma2 family endonuclease [Elainellaceae cyanobacterium]